MAAKLHGFSTSTCTRRAALVLKEYGVPYELVGVDMLVDAHKDPAHVAHQPFGQVPYLEDDGFELFESRAIGRYVAAKWASQGPPLLPGQGDLEKWAKFEQAASIEMSDFDVVTGNLGWEKLFKTFSGGVTDEKVVDGYLAILNEKLDAYEVLLSKTKYLGGNDITLADLFHLPNGTLMFAIGVNVLEDQRRPNVARWWKDISSRPAWLAVKDGA